MARSPNYVLCKSTEAAFPNADCELLGTGAVELGAMFDQVSDGFFRYSCWSFLIINREDCKSPLVMISKLRATCSSVCLWLMRFKDI